LNIIAIDVEKMRVKGHFLKNVYIACWIAFTNIEGKVFFNTFIRIPSTAIKKTYEVLHGIDKKMVKNRLSFNVVRRITFDYCKKADRIIMASPKGDFESIMMNLRGLKSASSKSQKERIQLRMLKTKRRLL